MKKANIVIRNRQGTHAGGGPERAHLVLKAGAKGEGRDIQVCEYWPWSPKSVDAAFDYLRAAADREGYEIVPE